MNLAKTLFKALLVRRWLAQKSHFRCDYATAAVATPASGAWPIRSMEISPRIAALKQNMELGDLRAMEERWQEASRTGTPVIEPAGGNPSEVIVRFVWRGNANTRNVALLAPLTYSC